nr:MAG TPA: hypothetical protein [Caudoviricetes sp.]
MQNWPVSRWTNLANFGDIVQSQNITPADSK